MTDLERYILEEWREDYQAGRLPRREFLRRVAVFSGGTALAATVLAQLGIVFTPGELAEAAAAPSPAGPAAPGVTVPPTDPAITVRTVSFPSGTVTVLGYLALPRAGTPAPGVVVVHENRGLVEHIKDVARRLARAGYVALAPDLASAEGGTERYTDPAQVTAILGRTPPDQLVAMLSAAVRHLQGLPQVRGDRIGAIGFCFGGGMVWRLITQNPDVRAAAPFYGPAPDLEAVPRIRAAVLAIYGERDERINAGIPALRERLQRANVVHEIVIYPNADHAFFNDTGPRYNAEAARDAWSRVLVWFERYLKAGG